ncbi:MAG: M56 family metallopeptidase, partial [Phycisphaeraceae bacterium]|nr:M56 family metallopeptidase [Phycisphaeraceae bacterium]
MNSLVTAWSHGIVHYLVATSLTAVVAIPAAWAFIRMVRVKAAVHRHMIWLYVLIGITAVPAVWLFAPKLPLAMLPARTEHSEAMSPSPSPVAAPMIVPQRVLSDAVVIAAPISTVPEIAIETRQAPRTFQMSVLLAGVWLTGVMVMLFRLGVGWRRLRRISLCATPASQNTRLAHSHFCTRNLFISSQVDSPVCLGVFRPVVLLPEAIVNTRPVEELQMILHHELAHVERKDCWINLAQCLVEAVYFFHPFIWYATHRLTQEREQICDSHVLAQGVTAEDYVALLHRIAKYHHHSLRFQSVALFEGRLLARVKSLLNPDHTPKLTSSWVARTACLAVFLLCGILGTIRLQARAVLASLEHQAITVIVQDVNGLPVANAAVEALAKYRPVAHAHTDISGRATLNVPQDAGLDWILALKSGVGFDYYENYENFYEPTDELPEQVTLELDGARAVSIKAIDTAGKPLPNVSFVPWTIIKKDRNWHVNLSGSDIAHVLTDTTGVAHFDWFPKDTSEDIHQEG